MITEIKPKLKKIDKRKQWNQVYFGLPRTIEVNGIKYRVFADYVWRKMITCYMLDAYHPNKCKWIYSLQAPLKGKQVND